MKLLFITMPVFNEFDVFGFFIVAALLFLFACFVYLLKSKLQIPVWKSTTLYFIIALFMLAGGRLFTISIVEWQNFFSTGIFPVKHGTTILGALILGPLGLIAGKRLLNINTPLLDFVAIPTLLAMAIQRLGCLFAGCCGGIVTGSSYGVSYAPYTSAHLFCAHNGTLETLDSYTPALHPAPLYLIGACMLSSVIIYLNKNRFKVSGSKFISAVILFLLGRFIVEFWREPLTENEFGNLAFGMKNIQWLLLVAGMLLSLIVFLREKKFLNTDTIVHRTYIVPDKKSFYHGLIILLLFTLVVFSTGLFFTPAEKVALYLLSSISLCAYALSYAKHYEPDYRFILSGISMLLLIVFLPITAQDSLKVSSNAPHKYNEVSFGIVTHNMEHYHEEATQLYSTVTDYDCAGNPYTYQVPNGYDYHEKYSHKLYAVAVGFSQHFDYSSYKHTYYRLIATGGIDKSNDPQERDGNKTDWLMNFEFGGGIDLKKFGLSTKLNLGRIRGTDQQSGDEPHTLTNGNPSFTLTPPSIAMRLGGVRNVYFDMRMGSNTYGLNTTGYPFLAGLGFGLQKGNGSFLRLNYGFVHDTGLFGFGTKFKISNGAIELDGLVNRDKYYYVGVTYSKYFGMGLK